MSTLKLVIDQGMSIEHGPERDTSPAIASPPDANSYYYGVPGDVEGDEVYVSDRKRPESYPSE